MFCWRFSEYEKKKSRNPAFMNIAICGTGNMAWQLAAAFGQRHSVSVLGRNEQALFEFGAQLKVATYPIHSIPEKSFELWVLCVKDEAVAPLSEQLPAGHAMVVHTSGILPMEVLHSKHSQTGVFYPFRSVRKYLDQQFRDIPLFVEANTADGLNLLKTLSDELGAKTLCMPASARQTTHLSAVLAHNLVNALMTESELILKEAGLDFNILRPLLHEYFHDLMKHAPSSLQTGPAMRGDRQTLAQHLSMLTSDPSLSEVYRLLSEKILKRYLHE